jgi:hypothetical protein
MEAPGEQFTRNAGAGHVDGNREARELTVLRRKVESAVWLVLLNERRIGI